MDYLNTKVLRQLSSLSRDVAHMVQTSSPFMLNAKQRKAIDSVLRTLDIRNDYEEGDRLRLAFQVELDAVKYHRQHGYYRKAETRTARARRRRKLLADVD